MNLEGLSKYFLVLSYLSNWNCWVCSRFCLNWEFRWLLIAGNCGESAKTEEGEDPSCGKSIGLPEGTLDQINLGAINLDAEGMISLEQSMFQYVWGV